MGKEGKYDIDDSDSDGLQQKTKESPTTTT